MFNVIKNIIDATWSSTNTNTYEQIILYVSGTLVIILTVTFIDLMYRLFRHFWR